MLICHRGSKQLENKLRGIGVRAELAPSNRLFDGFDQVLAPLQLSLDQSVTNRTWFVIEFLRKCHEQTPASVRLSVDPVEIPVHQLDQSRSGRRLTPGRNHNAVAKALERFLDHRELQRFLGMEMREEAALGETEFRCQRAQRRAPKSLQGRLPKRLIDDGFASGGTFSHEDELGETLEHLKPARPKVPAPFGPGQNRSGTHRVATARRSIEVS